MVGSKPGFDRCVASRRSDPLGSLPPAMPSSRTSDAATTRSPPTDRPSVGYWRRSMNWRSPSDSPPADRSTMPPDRQRNRALRLLYGMVTPPSKSEPAGATGNAVLAALEGAAWRGLRPINVQQAGTRETRCGDSGGVRAGHSADQANPTRLELATNRRRFRPVNVQTEKTVQIANPSVLYLRRSETSHGRADSVLVQDIGKACLKT